MKQKAIPTNDCHPEQSAAKSKDLRLLLPGEASVHANRLRQSGIL